MKTPKWVFVVLAVALAVIALGPYFFSGPQVRIKDYKALQGEMVTAFPHEGARAALVYASGQGELAIELVGAGMANPKVAKNTITYPEALPGVDLRYTALADRTKEEIIIKEPSEEVSLAFNIETGLDFRLLDKRGAAVVLDDQKRVVFSLPPWTARDAEGRELSPEVTFDGKTLKLRLDTTGAAFPVVIDPTVTEGDPRVYYVGPVYRGNLLPRPPDKNVNPTLSYVLTRDAAGTMFIEREHEWYEDGDGDYDADLIRSYDGGLSWQLTGWNTGPSYYDYGMDYLIAGGRNPGEVYRYGHTIGGDYYECIKSTNAGLSFTNLISRDAEDALVDYELNYGWDGYLYTYMLWDDSKKSRLHAIYWKYPGGEARGWYDILMAGWRGYNSLASVGHNGNYILYVGHDSYIEYKEINGKTSGTVYTPPAGRIPYVELAATAPDGTCWLAFHERDQNGQYYYKLGRGTPGGAWSFFNAPENAAARELFYYDGRVWLVNANGKLFYYDNGWRQHASVGFLTGRIDYETTARVNVNLSNRLYFINNHNIYYVDLTVNRPPDPPAITAPAQDSWVNTERPGISFNLYDPDGNSMRYQLQVAADAGFSSVLYDYTSPGSYANGSVLTHTPSANLGQGTRYARVRAYDGYVWGGWSATRTFRIDTGPPTVSFSPASRDWGNTDVTVNVFVTDALSGVASKQYAWSTSTSTPSSGWVNLGSSATLTLEGIWYLHVKATDAAGNTKTAYSGPYRIDKTPPTVSFSPASRNWGSTDVTVSVSVSDDLSGVSSKQYAWSTSTATPSSWNTLGDSVTLSSEGVWYLHVRATDAVGNIKTVFSGPYKIDKTPPEISFDLPMRDWGNVDVSVTVQTSDALSGVSSRQYAWSSSTSTPSAWYALGSSVVQTAEGAWYLHVRAYDAAGNVKTVYSGPYKIDKTPPTVPGTPTTPTPTNKSFQTWFWPASGDALSGLARYEVCLDGNSIWSSVGINTFYTTNFTSDGTHILKVRAVDNAGNISAEASASVLVDLTPPAVVFNPGLRTWSSSPVTVNLTISDNLTGIASKQYAWSASTTAPASWSNQDGDSVVQSDEGEWFLHVKLKDGAGNETITYSGPYQIDIVTPPELIGVEKWYYTTTPTFSWDFSDPDDPQTAYQVVVERETDGNVVYDSGKVMSSATSFTLPTSYAPDTPGPLWLSGTYKFAVRVRVWNQLDNPSDWSTPRYFKILAFERPRVKEIVNPPAGQVVPNPDNPATHIVIKPGMTATDLPGVKAGTKVTMLVDSVGPVSTPAASIAVFPYGSGKMATVGYASAQNAPGSPVNRWEFSFWTDASLSNTPDGTVVKMWLTGTGTEGGTTTFNAPPYAEGVVRVEGSVYDDWFVVMEGRKK